MPFALIGFFYGLKIMNYAIVQALVGLLIFSVILCMVFARSAAMAFNRWLDAEFDAKNPRTLIREIPAALSPKRNAMIFVIFNCVAFVGNYLFY